MAAEDGGGDGEAEVEAVGLAAATVVAERDSGANWPGDLYRRRWRGGDGEADGDQHAGGPFSALPAALRGSVARFLRLSSARPPTRTNTRIFLLARVGSPTPCRLRAEENAIGLAGIGGGALRSLSQARAESPKQPR